MLLLPLSILTNEVLLLQPHSHYLRWINTSLIRGEGGREGREGGLERELMSDGGSRWVSQV